MPDPNPIGDSSHYISAEAYELVEYLYYDWNIYKENQKVKVERGYRSLSSMANDEEMPCSNCHSKALCAEDGYSCNHMKEWVTKGKYDKTSCSWK